MNLKAIGLWSVRKENFSIFTCVFAREYQSHVCGKSLDRIHVCCHVDLFTELNIAVCTLFLQVNVRCCSRVYLGDLV